MRMYPEPSDRMMNVEPVKPNEVALFFENFFTYFGMALVLISFVAGVVGIFILAYQRGGIFYAILATLSMFALMAMSD